MPHVPHLASSSGASTLGLVLMIVSAHLGSSAEAADLLLNVEGGLVTTTAHGVRVRTAYTFRHLAGSEIE